MMCVFDRDSLVCGIKLSITHIDIYISTLVNHPQI